jgi:predicted Zn-dependent protease with MMP-like domain
MSQKSICTAREFEVLVNKALKSLPRKFKQRFENIAVVIRKEPTATQRREAGISPNTELLGLYEGVPLGKRTHNYGNILPDKITIFRDPILRSCAGPREIRKAVQHTILHEFAHYFGISDEHMLEEGTY